MPDKRDGSLLRGDRWVTIEELGQMLGLSKLALQQLAKGRGLPLRRVTPYATPGVLESELIPWIKKQPRLGSAIKRLMSHRKKKVSPKS